MLKLHVIDDVTVGVAIPGDTAPEQLQALDERLATAAVRARCLIVNMSCGRLAGPELAGAVARQLERARQRGYLRRDREPWPRGRPGDRRHRLEPGGRVRADGEQGARQGAPPAHSDPHDRRTGSMRDLRQAS